VAENTVRIRSVFDDKVSSSLDSIRKKFDGLSQSKGAQSILGGVGLGVGAKAFSVLDDAIAGVGDQISQSIKAASDLNETMSKSRIVFGSSARGIDDWGDTAARAMGLSKQAATEAAASLGNLFLGADVGQAQAADMSKSLVQLGADLASFNNLDPTVTLDKLRSGVVGEAEPLRVLGVQLTEAKVKAKGMQLGLGNAHGELSEGEKILARYQVILDETGSAQGNFALTAKDLANSQKTANAALDDARAKLGEKFIPVAIGTTQAQIGLVDAVVATSEAVTKLGVGWEFMTTRMRPPLPIEGWQRFDKVMENVGDRVMTVDEQLEALRRQAAVSGSNIGTDWIRGISQGIRTHEYLLDHELDRIAGDMKGKSPPKTGPLKDLDVGAERIGQAWAQSFAKGLGDAQQQSRRVLDGLALAGGGQSMAVGGGGMARGLLGGGGLGAPATEVHHHHIYLDGREIGGYQTREKYYELQRTPRTANR
jgi:hypothetical protein